MENFSSKKVAGVRQDFYACILWGNISGLLTLDAQQQVVQQEDTPINAFYRINRSVSLGLLKDELIDIHRARPDYRETTD